MRCYFFGLILSALLTFSITMVPDVGAVGLENSDCIKCHTQAVTDVEVRGRKHGTEVACLDCHLEHPPQGVNTIPACGMCHSKASKEHYALQQCLVCHSPHAPLEIDFSGVESINPICSSCHLQEGGQLVDYPSLHSELNCSECHSSHGSWQSCLVCHNGHSADMTYEDCLRCHKPHMPSVVRYDARVPNGWCSECHIEIVDVLAENRSKHHGLLCVYCHRDQHQMMPNCETCHNRPHAVAIHKKFPDCRECHNGPHALDTSP